MRQKEVMIMTYKQYRACLFGVIAAALLCGVLICYKYEKETKIPSDGVLVQELSEEDYGILHV